MPRYRTGREERYRLDYVAAEEDRYQQSARDSCQWQLPQSCYSYLRGEGKKPKADAAFAGLMRLAADSRFDKNVSTRT